MFEIKVPRARYVDPWAIPLERRISELRRGSFRVAYVYERADNSTFRYRVYNVGQSLRLSGSSVTSSYFFYEELSHVIRMASDIDVLVICRSRYTLELESLVNRMRLFGRKVYFDVDDLVFDTRFVPLLFEVLALDKTDETVWDYWFSYTARLGAALKLCDGVIATNLYLAECAAEYSKLPTGVIPNFMNKEQCDYSRRLYDAKAASRYASNGPVHLAYFSGSPSHDNDYRILEPALVDALRRYPDLRLMMVGYISPGRGLDDLHDRVDQFPFQDFVNLQRLVASAEVNLMPLQNSVFSNCKSELKFFEAAIVGTVSVASPAESYRAAIDHGRTGLISFDHDWADRIDSMLDLLANRRDYAEMALAAHDTAERRHVWSAQAEGIERVLTGL